MSSLDSIEAKVQAGERLTYDDGMALFMAKDLLRVGMLANRVREKLHGDKTYFNVNMRYEATNVCEAACRFCAFQKLEEGMPGSRTVTHAQAWATLRDFPDARLTELHMVNGLNPNLPFEWYEELLRGWKRVRPSVHLKCFTAVEIHYFSEKFGMSYREVLMRLRAAGLDSMPGGGAEILDEDIRRRIAQGKATGAQYLEVHRVAHELGMRTNVTMLYGHIETFEHRVDHLLKLRALQDETGGIQCFIPLAFHNENPRPLTTSRPSPSAGCSSTMWPTSKPIGSPWDSTWPSSRSGLAPMTSTVPSCTKPSTTRPAATCPWACPAAS
jgi:aminodeoxyfutalosine synthase